MNRLLPSLLMALLAANAWAAKSPAVAGEDHQETHDDVEQFLQGAAVDLVATRDTDKFDRNITRLGTMAHYKSRNDFIAVGASSNLFSQGDWSLRVNSLVTQYRKVNPATAEGINARAAIAFHNGKQEFHGEAGWNIRFNESTGVELIANRDAIETEQALKNSIMANFFATSFDHALSEQLTVIGMPTYRSFSDGNEQVGLRGWLIYNFAPEYGLGMQVKGMGYGSSQNGDGNYFSPDNYERAEIGLRMRRAMGNWRVYATADIGKERIDRDIVKPTGQFVLSAQRNFANNLGLGVQLARYRATDTSSSVDSSETYAWNMARVYFTIPF